MSVDERAEQALKEWAIDCGLHGQMSDLEKVLFKAGFLVGVQSEMDHSLDAVKQAVVVGVLLGFIQGKAS